MARKNNRKLDSEFRDAFASWLEHNKFTARASLLRLLKTPVSSIMACLVIGIAMALPAGFLLTLEHINSLTGDLNNGTSISLFLHKDSEKTQQQELLDEVKGFDELNKAWLVTPEEALEELKQHSGFEQLIDGLAKNPLPPVIVVQAKPGTDSAVLEGWQTSLAENEIVELAQLDLEWAQRLQSVMALGSQVASMLRIVLGLGVVLIIGNTIQLSIESRRNEIIISKLVGGTDAFVRRPFLYTGWWYGFGGGIVALVIITTGLWSLSDAVSELSSLYYSEFRLSGPGFLDSVQLLLLSGLLGITGAWLASSQHLSEVETF